AALPPRERRRQLDERLRKDPKDVAANLLLVELDLSEGKTAPAAARAEQTVAFAPGDSWAICLRGLTRASAPRCGAAVGDLEVCVQGGRDPRFAQALQGCHVELAKAGPPQKAPPNAAANTVPPRAVSPKAVPPKVVPPPTPKSTVDPP